MADPFSIAAGTLGIVDVCTKFVKFCKHAKTGFSQTDGELDRLADRAQGLREDIQVLQSLSKSRNVADMGWLAIENAIRQCSSVTQDLDLMMTSINKTTANQQGLARLDKYRKYFRHLSKEKDLNKQCERLESCRNQLQNAKITFLMKGEVTRVSVGDTTAGAQALKIGFECFDIPQSVSSIYTGRTAELGSLSACLFGSTGTTDNRRFVIYGMAGSGKTQFCCKFAALNKSRFWAVFTIDATSPENMKRSFATLAKIGRVDSSPAAVKNWLSTLDKFHPWLLIIDNADDESLQVEDYFPDSEHGIILLTTRNPLLKTHGTVGPRFFEFAQLEEAASIDLLLLAAADAIHPGRADETLQAANEICTSLGHLPLAILHAGKTILSRQCTIWNYMTHYRKSWTSVRKLEKRRLANADAATAIYSTFEVLHDGLVAKQKQSSQDALDLLKIVAHLHNQHIRKDIFSRAVQIPVEDRRDEEKKQEEEAKVSRDSRRPKSWSEIIKEALLGVAAAAFYPDINPVLPTFLTATIRGTSLWNDSRLSSALDELLQLGLIDFSPDSVHQSFSIHPAVHQWLRLRPQERRHADQAIDCHVAANILTQAIRRPNFEDTEEEETFKRDVLSHVIENTKSESAIITDYQLRQTMRQRTWPPLQSRMTRNKALQHIKFSVIYYQGGQLAEAEKLQLEVLDFVKQKLGPEHEKTTGIMLLLSKTYWQMIRIEDAAALQKQVLDIYTKIWGPEHIKTLRVTNYYASTLWLQGQIPQALHLLEATVRGYERLPNSSRADMLRAKSDLGRAVSKDFRFDEAITIHLEVVAGLREELSPHHLDTISAMDNLAMAYFDRAAHARGHPGDLSTADTIESQVFAQRKEKLGPEHWLTLWAGLNLARIKAFRGQIDEALAIRQKGHDIAIRIYPKGHFARLFGKMHYGRILTYAKRYEEADGVLTDVVETYPANRKHHPDRLLAIFSLIKVRQVLGREKGEIDGLMEELLVGVERIFGKEHAWYRWMQNPGMAGEHDSKGDVDADAEVWTYTKGDAVEMDMIARLGHAARDNDEEADESIEPPA